MHNERTNQAFLRHIDDIFALSLLANLDVVNIFVRCLD